MGLVLRYPWLLMPGLWAGIMVCHSFARGVGLFYVVCLIVACIRGLVVYPLPGMWA